MFAYLARHKFGAVFFVLVAIGAVVLGALYLRIKQEDSRRLYEPKLLMLRIDEVPFQKGSKTPVDVMEGMAVSIACENIVPPADVGKASYRFKVAGRVVESETCEIETPIPGGVDTVHAISLEYLFKKPKGEKRVVDRWDASVRIVSVKEHLQVRNFASKEGRPISGRTVPREVIPNVEGVLKLDGATDDYVVLFFVESFGTDVPVLQVTGRPSSEQRIEAISAPLTRVRRFGPGVGGYAAWPREPILVGAPEDERMIFEISAGLFKKKEIPAALAQLVSFEGRDKAGEAIVKILPKTVDEIKTLTWHRWLSEPVRVVRAASAPAGADGQLPSAAAAESEL